MPESVQPQSENQCNATAVDSDGGLPNPVDKRSAARSVEEMRSSTRKKYEVSQRIAPMHSKILPQVDEYFNVECNDISRGGISFYLKRPPGCEQFAILLGQKPSLTTLIGRVVYSRIVDHNGEKMYLVGCQFIDRLQD